jgi:hypothetical protein
MSSVETANGADATESPTPSTPGSISRRRLIFVDALVTFNTLLVVVAMFSVWANRLLFSPDNWAKTSTQLLQNPDIRSTTANYLVDQLYANVNVPNLIRSGLPTQLQSLAAPAAGALRNAAVQGTDLALTRPRVQDLWAQANRAADQTFINIVNGGKGAVGVNQGAVTLNLALIVDDIASRLGLPSDIGSKLPANIATLTVFKADQLKYVQNGGNAIKGLALWLTILCPLLYGLAILLAPGHRRRTMMTAAGAVLVAGVLVLLARSILASQIAGSLTNVASLRATISAVVSIATGILAEIAGACIFVGAVVIACGWFAGPSRIARSGREAIAPFLRENPVGTYALTLALMVLIFIWDPIPATGKIAGMVVFTVLALFGTYVLRRQTEREFPDARPGTATQRLRERLSSMRGRRDGARAATAAAPDTIPEQLRQLADLRDNGAISDGDYQAAKAQLLHS